MCSSRVDPKLRVSALTEEVEAGYSEWSAQPHPCECVGLVFLQLHRRFSSTARTVIDTRLCCFKTYSNTTRMVKARLPLRNICKMEQYPEMPEWRAPCGRDRKQVVAADDATRVRSASGVRVSARRTHTDPPIATPRVLISSERVSRELCRHRGRAHTTTAAPLHGPHSG